MTFPGHPDKHKYTPVLKAVDLLAHRRNTSKLREFRARNVIVLHHAATLSYAVKRYKGRKIQGLFGEVYILRGPQERIAIAGNFGIGAPATAALLEEMAVLGVQRCVSIGVSGGLQRNLEAGQLILVTNAIRDEGTSYHYAPRETIAQASLALTNCLESILAQHRLSYLKGTVWTTDAPYRETAAEVEQYQREGVLTVEMEASALFIVGAALGIETACGLVVADSLAGGVWQPPSNNSSVLNSMRAVLGASIEALSS